MVVNEMIGSLKNLISRNEEPSYFESAAQKIDRLMKDAADQFLARDHTHLKEPVRYNVLWLGFTHVTYGELDFRMTGFDREYLQAVVLNFEKFLEKITDHDIDVTVDLHFIEDEAPLTLYESEGWLYLAQTTVQPVIDRYLADNDYDTVLTTVQTDGNENRFRNFSKKEYSEHPVILGLCVSDLLSPMGYSTFNLGKPREGTYPLEDPETPSLYSTAVAVHEWMHQLEALGTLLGIEYPNTHAYMGPELYPGYLKYTAGKNDYDFFEFYKLVLSGTLPYKDNGVTRFVGMYPKMWPLAKRSTCYIGRFLIQDADGKGYLTGRKAEPTLTLSKDPCIWDIRYSGNGLFILSPRELPDKRIDLSNAWDSEGNTINLWDSTGYAKAQSWKLDKNRNGTYSIRTAFESGCVLTAQINDPTLLCSKNRFGGVQNWNIRPV